MILSEVKQVRQIQECLWTLNLKYSTIIKLSLKLLIVTNFTFIPNKLCYNNKKIWKDNYGGI